MYSTTDLSVGFLAPYSDLLPLCKPKPRNQATSDALQAVLRRRKTWKSRGGEPIWPLDLEAALLEALEKYRPEDCRETLMLGRFPRRNRFISDYIFNNTGKRRSPKQVGSRLQQLRDCCEDMRVRQLICPWPKPPPYSASSVATNSALSSVPPLEGGLLPNSLAPPNTVIYIDILQEGLPENTRCGITSSPWPDVGDGAIIHASDHPRCLKTISPTVSFIAPSPLIAHSRFTVRAEDAVLHAETVPLVLVVDKTPQPAAYLYSTQLVPKYWNVLVDDITRLTILQEVVQTETSCLLFSAAYKFNYHRHSETLSSVPLAFRDALPEFPARIPTYTPCNLTVSQPPARFPMDRCATKNTTFPSLPFPADLSNYIS
ncbi:hypothetical protein DFH08DRAFT_1007938 [Mycena albidolilacea]|uniref:TEA domain-containing protein n=1 Tax=Mycena albidolilacea TaxID=1033008 RepID=A0AAD6ZZP3_9AGAR|nr:hypothetical protein DFH08DRAFT_1007938 [Mycena albidolilacea]